MKSDLQIVSSIFKSEGWPTVTNDPSDLGGLTVGGITYTSGCAFTRQTFTREEFIAWATTRENATAFYIVRHVRPFELLEDPLRLFVIDLGVLRGVSSATKMLQGVVGADTDGWIGPQTISKVKDFARNTLPLLIGARLFHIEERIRENPSQLKYRKGWRNRTLAFLEDV